MSLRVALFKLWHNGRALLRPQQYRQVATDWNQTVKINLQNIRAEFKTRPSVGRTSDSFATASKFQRQTPSFVQAQYDSARRVFVDNILRRVTNSLSSDLRKRTARLLLFGNSTPFFAFVGVSLASGTGIITKEDELEGICWEIREAVAKMQESLSRAESDLLAPGEHASLNKFSIGPLIGIGANAVVHAVKKLPTQVDDNVETETNDVQIPPQPLVVSSDSDLKHFPCAMKSMFNYYLESNAPRIIRGMFREIIPSRLRFDETVSLEPWQMRFIEDSVELPSHPNVVTMHCVFVDWVRDLPGTHSACPMALPPSLYSEGLSRNKTLYILMKRYDTTLKKYIEDGKVNIREGIVLLTQLLEGVAHINTYGIAHRDLKTDNILLETDEGEDCPMLVISDFGCCLPSMDGSLTTPYRTQDTDIGGNIALMAPEILKVEPGLFSSLDYSKSDCWSCGALAYELFTGRNPFYPGKHGDKSSKHLRSQTYSVAQLPRLDEYGVPLIVAKLIQSILDPNSKKRPSAEFAATILQVYLWGPTSWQKSPMPASNEILQWLLCLTTKVLCGGGIGSHRSNAEFHLIGSFLRRSRLSNIRQALNWIQENTHSV